VWAKRKKSHCKEENNVTVTPCCFILIITISDFWIFIKSVF
jgi:hypothetical protein